MSPHGHVYRPNLFRFTGAISAEDVEGVLYEFMTVVNKGNFLKVLQDVLDFESEIILPLIFTTEDRVLHSFITDSFPSSGSHFLTSVHSRILFNLAKFFVMFPSWPLDVHRPSYLDSVSCSSAVLRTIASLKFSNSPVSETDFKKGQRARKNVRKANAQLQSIDPQAFIALGLKIPVGTVEAENVVSQVLQEQKTILECLLSSLQLPDLRSAIISGLVSLSNAKDDMDRTISPSNPAQTEETESSSTSNEVPPAFPAVQPMKSALYFDSPEEFGSWSILISNNANTKLRSFCKREPKIFGIILKKIRELSDGRFSDDNHKRLIGSQLETPVFEAKMTSDLRLIYQIDCIPYDDEHEQQAIKIFDVCTHAQMDGRLWDSVSRQMIRKGKEYQQRCGQRDKVAEGVFRPVLFPPLPEAPVQSEMLPQLALNEPFSRESHSRLLMDKFMAFSKPVLNAMLADIELTFPHMVSFKEKEIIEHLGPCYVLGRSGTGKTTTMLFKMLLNERSQDLAGGDIPKPRQVFVTQSRVLAKKVKRYFWSLVDALKAANLSIDDLAAHRPSYDGLTQDDLDHGDDTMEYTDLPLRFSDLSDTQFPLITTVDQLWSMIEADIISDVAQNPRPKSSRSSPTLTYTTFQTEYWPRFSETLTKHLDPALVFSQILGIIKGSEGSLTGDSSFLDLARYEGLTDRVDCTFSAHRKRIYEIFEKYQKIKASRREFDAADRTHAIIAAFKKSGGFKSLKIDNLYVDEVQDNLLIDTLVLRAICRDGNTVFWAGDTAQTISMGSSFRFNELKAFQYRLEKTQNKVLRPLNPEMFQLCVNYRSHAGIVDCAHSIIELLTYFWPNSIDRLQPEKGIVDGARPVFITGWDEDSVQLEQFLFGETGNPIEFGAQQCIIVRTEAARDKLQNQVGHDLGLVMTIYESKGLEFNDVLLYNFFEDSEVELSQWRIILRALDECNAPQFDELRHASVCAELKFLYVAITRARENVWIADCSLKADPIRTFWTRRSLVTNATPSSGIPQLARSSTPEEWAKMGESLLENDRYAFAERCFLKASLPDRAALAHAFYLRSQANRVPEAKIQQRKDAFLEAAETFLHCGYRDPATLSNFVRSAECFLKAGEKVRAAEAFFVAKKYQNAAEIYRDLRMFDEAVDIVQTYQVDHPMYESVIAQAKLYYFTRKKYEKAIKLFSSIDDGLEYLDDRDLNDARAVVLQSAGRIEEAAELYLQENRTLEAIMLFLSEPENGTFMKRAAQCVIEALWESISFGVMPEHVNSSTIARSFLDAAEKVKMPLVRSEEQDQIAMFRAIFAGDPQILRQLGVTFRSRNNVPAALLTLDHYYSRPPTLGTMSATEVAAELELFLSYVQMLMTIHADLDPCGSSDIIRLFAIRKVTENDFLVPVHSYLGQERRQDETLSASAVSDALRSLMSERLQSRVQSYVEAARRSPALSPCEGHTVFGRCNRPSCPKEHLSSSFTPELYNTRVRIHLQAVILCHILQTFDKSDHPPAEHRDQKFWFNRLYDALFPPHQLLGTYSNLNRQVIPEAHRGFQIMQEWVRTLVYTLDFHPATPFLTALGRCANFALVFDERVLEYFSRNEILFRNPPLRYRREDSNSIVQELLVSYQGHKAICLHYGILYVKHVITNSLPINVSLLCDFIDFLCARLIAGNHIASKFHGVLVPRSWYIQYMDVNEKLLRNWDTKFTQRAIIDPIPQLLEQMYTGNGAEYLLFGSRRNLADLPKEVRNIFILRILWTLGLFGHNIFLVRERIVLSIRSLRRPERRFPSAYSSVIQAESWQEVAVATRSLVKTPLDPLIQLVHSTRPSNNLPLLDGITRIVFDSVQDIPRLLASGNSTSQSLAEGQIHQEQEEFADLPEPDDGQPDQQKGQDSELPQAIGLTDVERNAASRIMKVLKKWVAQRKRESRADAFARFWNICMKQSKHVPAGKYLLLFRGPLPHILHCLDVMQKQMHQYKKGLKEQLLGPDLEGLDDKLTQTNKLFKSIMNLQKNLHVSPDLATIHQKGDISELGKLVAEVKSLAECLPISMDGIKQHLDKGFKGISAQAKQKRLPVLNTSDL